MLDADWLLAGLAGRAELAKGDGEGWCNAGVPDCDEGCRGSVGGGAGAVVGIAAVVGVACGVDCAEALDLAI